MRNRVLGVVVLSLVAACAASHELEAGFERLDYGLSGEALTFFEDAVAELEARPRGRTAMQRALLGYGRSSVAVALDQMLPPYELWAEVAPTVDAAALALRRARELGAPWESVEAPLATAAAIGQWYAIRDGRPGGLTSASVLALVEPHVESYSEAARLTLEVQLADGELEAVDATLADAIVRWPGYAPLHLFARDHRDELLDPTAITAAISSWLEQPLDIDEVKLASMHVTRGLLGWSWGLTMYAEGDLDEATRLFEDAARDLARGREHDVWLSADEVDLHIAQAHRDAGWSSFHLEDLEAAEAAFAAALEQVPDDQDAILGLGYVGNALYEQEMAQARDFFGRIAERFETNADWWNNYAFLCRETGLYEESYAAYERCIAIDPDDARRVNDTGLILLYHLDRDLDYAEELFERAWALGREVCENPFVSQDRYDENFLAYTDAMLNLSLLHLQRGDLARADEVMDELLEIAPDRLDARQLRGRIDRAIAAAEAEEG